MKFLLTGGSGFIGTHLAALLTSRGHPVTAFVRPTSVRTGLAKAGASFAVGDLAKGDGIAEALEGVECVMHLAGVTKARTPDEYHLGNAEGTRRLVEAMAARPNPPRLVYCSSLAAAGPTRVGAPKREDDQPRPVSTYGKSKLGGELAVRRYADRVPAVIVRPPIVYGPGDKENVPPFLPMGRFGVFLKAGLGPKHFSFIHVADLCEGLYLAALKGKAIQPGDPASGVYFLSDGHEYSWEEFCATVARALGKGRPRVLSFPDIVGYAAGWGSEIRGRLLGTVPILNRDKAREMSCEAWTCSTQRAQDDFAYQPAFDLEAGLADTIAWYRKEGWIR